MTSIPTPSAEARGRALYAPRDHQEDVWLLHFSDNDMESIIFSGAGCAEAAVKAWERYNEAWTCTLFRVATLPPQDSSGDARELLDDFEIAVRNDVGAQEQLDDPAAVQRYTNALLQARQAVEAALSRHDRPDGRFVRAAPIRDISEAQDRSAPDDKAIFDDVREQVRECALEGIGFWRSCSGCYETNEGYPTARDHPAFGCALGGGCSECGGIGAIWDTTDYGKLADDMLAASPSAPRSDGDEGGFDAERFLQDDTGLPLMSDSVLCPVTGNADIEVRDSDAVCVVCRGKGNHAPDCPRKDEPWPTIKIPAFAATPAIRDQAFEEAATSLLNEIWGLKAFESEVRSAISNTNYAVLMNAADKLARALKGTSPTEIGGGK